MATPSEPVDDPYIWIVTALQQLNQPKLADAVHQLIADRRGAIALTHHQAARRVQLEAQLQQLRLQLPPQN